MKLVRYCPGSTSGSPAFLHPTTADELLKKDSHSLQRLININSAGEDPVMPHIGTCPTNCPHNEEYKI